MPVRLTQLWFTACYDCWRFFGFSIHLLFPHASLLRRSAGAEDVAQVWLLAQCAGGSGFDTPTPTRHPWFFVQQAEWRVPEIPSLGRQREEGQKFKGPFGYVTSLRSGWAVRVCISKTNKKKSSWGPATPLQLCRCCCGVFLPFQPALTLNTFLPPWPCAQPMAH